MLAVLTSEEMRQLDYETIIKLRVSERQLMELAGKESYNIILKEYGKSGKCIQGKRFLVISGKGNNGGDGIVLTRHLINGGAHVDLAYLCLESQLKDDGLATLKSLKQYLTHTDRLRIIETDEAIPSIIEQASYDFIVDAILGTGYTNPDNGRIKSPIREAIAFINQKKSGPSTQVIAIDTPSGLDCTSGQVADIAVKADLTISLGFLNTGLFLEDGRNHSGKIALADISIPSFLINPSHAKLIDDEFVRQSLPKRTDQSAKHENGKVLIIAGNQTRKNSMMGAAILSAKAAIVSGAGYVCASIPQNAFNMFHMAVPEAIIIDQSIHELEEKLHWADSVLIGPGFGRTDERQAFIVELLNQPALKQKKIVLDADALFALSELDSWPILNHAILTPHLKEFERLSHVCADDIRLNRLKHVREFSKKYAATVLLKGAPTLVGNSQSLYFSDSGTEALATAGTGDVLSGIIAAFVAQGLDILEAGAIGAYIHGKAGQHSPDAKNRTSAMSVLAALSEVFLEFES